MQAHHHHARDPEEDDVKTGDQRVGRIIALHLRVAALTLNQNHGLPIRRLKGAIDALHRVLDLDAQICVPLDPCAAGRRDLNEPEFFKIPRVLLK